MSYTINVSSPQSPTTPTINVVFGDVIFLPIISRPASVAGKARPAGAVAGDFATAYAVGKTAAASVVGDWEVR